MKAITGNTYPVKDSLKAMGGRWDSTRKVWMVPDVNAIKAQGLVDSMPARHSGPRDTGSTYTRFNSGAEVWTNRNGRCEDAPCCGCCSN